MEIRVHTSKKKSFFSDIINLIGLLSIGIISYFFSLLSADFADLHISLPYLGFPVFIVELLLAVCILLLILKWLITGFRFNR